MCWSLETAFMDAQAVASLAKVSQAPYMFAFTLEAFEPLSRSNFPYP
ncbi:predicted protein [Plenodomus lingam JN3]|uniref:Predicted protein n=1 Tax=Leptosphaeria maculans (strain JN3 / isolate v23.1.3 / race Av1-4-5-6-7-8) TaxID=985895 RepID=E5R574_LEPMJ|nr:predicted protein [Plenodomus lingam JN3]CBX92044.1 predicted protein [Plenodomus lingam JN3]